jgi:hypothetical protein
MGGLRAQLAGGHNEVHTDGKQHQHQTSPAGKRREQQQQKGSAIWSILATLNNSATVDVQAAEMYE